MHLSCRITGIVGYFNTKDIGTQILVHNTAANSECSDEPVRTCNFARAFASDIYKVWTSMNAPASNYKRMVMPAKSDSDVIFCSQLLS